MPAVVRPGVRHGAHDAQRGGGGKAGVHDAEIAKCRRQGGEEGLVAGFQGFERGERALGLRGADRPGFEPAAHLLAIAAFLIPGERRGPRPAGKIEGLGRDQRGEAALPFGQDVVELEAGRGGAAALAGRDPGEGCGVGIALEDDVERVAGIEEERRPPPGGAGDEGVELLAPHHRAASHHLDQGHERAVPAQQHAVLERRGGHEEGLHALPAGAPQEGRQAVEGLQHVSRSPGARGWRRSRCRRSRRWRR